MNTRIELRNGGVIDFDGSITNPGIYKDIDITLVDHGLFLVLVRSDIWALIARSLDKINGNSPDNSKFHVQRQDADLNAADIKKLIGREPKKIDVVVFRINNA